MKKILLIVILILTCSKANQPVQNQQVIKPLQDNLEYSETNLKDFSIEVLSSLDKTFIIQDDLLKDIVVYYKPNQNNLNFLMQVLNNNDYEIKIINNVYYILKVIKKDDLEEKENLVVNTIQLHKIDFEYIKTLFTVYKDIEFTFIPSSKLLILKSTQSDYENIKKIVSYVDNTPKQLKVKITILDTNLNKIKEYGSELTQNINQSSNFFFNLLAYPFQVASNVDNTQKDNFTSFIKLLNQNSITELVASPTLTLSDNEPVAFNLGKNIPYLSGSTTVEDSNTKTTNSYTYKDVGLKISITPKIFNDEVQINLELTNEIILDSSNTPKTSKSYIKQVFSLSKNRLFVLTGINQTQTYEDTQKSAFLGDIPFLGWLFKTNSNDLTNSNLTILLELVDDDNVTTSDFIMTDSDNKKFNQSLEHQRRVNQILGVK
jgi:general secretion pathway protein D